MSVIIETSIGDLTVDLYTDERSRCCINFLKLCKIKYYNFSLFHTVQQNLVAQTGDPTATGRGGESIFARLYGEQARFFDMEVTPRIKHSKKGLISMVNNGSGMHGSQFFFTLADNLDYLDGKHTVFGEVTEGFEILDKLNNTFCGEDNRPHQDIRIYHTIILDDPYDDPDGLVVPATSPGPTEEMLNSDHIPCDADIDKDKDKTEEELAEIMAEKEAKANTQILEMVGDLPDAEVAPPDNVLFVCKLNPVTTSEDLEIIFSRFGPVVSCEVIKDAKTGESLQYAFVEFEKPENCESAYFKMDNVLIDDRRIHVDFSQSVSKLKWKGKGQGVEIMATGDAPIYVLKNQQRRNDGYDLVYEEHPSDNPKKSKLEKKKKSKNLSDHEEREDKYVKKRGKSRSRSPVARNRSDYDKDNYKNSRQSDSRHTDTRKRNDYDRRGREDDTRLKKDDYDSRERSRDDRDRKKNDRREIPENRSKRDRLGSDENGKGDKRKRKKSHSTSAERERGHNSTKKDNFHVSSDSDEEDHGKKKKRKKSKKKNHKKHKRHHVTSSDESDQSDGRKRDKRGSPEAAKKSKKKHKADQYSSASDN
ncbi:unnamed protein product [Lymnaea stagnalis]|uniref:Peptidyl-prolyl cis-trans isomerase n=1 Tax=Lymnaea stagnalis TaxID=6523 RepID=A0AAV2HJ19_LYMST